MDMAVNTGTQTEQFMLPSRATPHPTIAKSSLKSDLDKLPPELRRMIFKELLVNPILGTPEAIPQSTGHGVLTAYGLSPAILCTSRAIYEEALPILYDQTFIIQCDYSDGNEFDPLECDYPCPCPLLRNLVRPAGSTRKLEIPAQSSAMMMACSWKVLVDPSIAKISHHQQFFEFCRAICSTSPKKIEVVVLKTPCQRVPTNLGEPVDFNCLRPWQTLAPISMLRNVGELSIRNEYPPYLHEDEFADPDELYWKSHGPGKVLSRMLKTLAESDRPTERLFEMKKHLEKLAQSYERYLPFKLDMIFPKSVHDRFKPRGENADELEKLGYTSYLRYEVQNPFHHGRRGYNHLEQCLSWAADAVVGAQNLEFKDQRDLIIKDLRPQYDRLLAASEKLQTLKFRMPIKHRFYEARKNYHHACASWLVMLDSYAKEFERGKDLGTLAGFRRQKRRFDRLHATWPREKMLAELQGMLEDENFEDFSKVAEEVEEDMNRQLADMTAAWKNLFIADVYPGERFCNAELSLIVDEESSSSDTDKDEDDE
ncbi:hypothetical protein MFRU_035g00460 [Monilinia fructicola]|nr:hypothetical protein MFRU_035g00460 [Monilinia fructicola]